MGGGSSKIINTVMDIGVELDTFEGKYVGSVPVKSAKGSDVCEDAVTRILSLKQPERAVLIRVTSMGVFLIDAKTGDLLKDVRTPEVSFVSMDPRDSRIISFFEQEESLRLVTCHTFRISKNALQLPITINEAFKVMAGQVSVASVAKLKRKVSKKEALAESRAGPAITKGDLMETYEAQYLGCMECAQPRGDDVITAAAAHIAAKKSKPIPVTINIYTHVFAVVDGRNKEILACHVRDIPHAKLSQDALTFSVIVADRRFGDIQAYSFAVQPLPEGRQSIRRSIDIAMKKSTEVSQKEEEAKRQAQEALAKTVGDTSSEVATGTILGVHEASYLGSVTVTQQKGVDVVEEAYETLRKQRGPIQGVFMQLGTESVKVLDALTHEVITIQVVKNVSFTCVIGDKENIFSYITVDEKINLFTCSFFLCVGRGAFEIAHAFGDVFKAIAEEQAKIGENPFAGIGERLVPPEDLFKIQIHRSDLTAVKVIGAGNFGQVYLADQKTDSGRVRRAVKMLRGGASEADRKAFIRESQVQMKLDHPNLVGLVGVAMQQRPWLMVLDYCEYGDLRGVLKACEARKVVLSHAEQLNLALQIAKGMAHLAKLRFVHLDLAARNCLVAHGTVVQVADFGLSRELPPGQDYWQSETVLRLPVKWCSIEALDERMFSEGSDVWAFGVTMWEISSYGAMPYEELKAQEVQRKVREGVRLHKSPHGSDEYHKICSSCWVPDRTARPKFEQLQKQIRAAWESMGTPPVRDVAALLTGSK